VASILGEGRWEADGGRVYLRTDQAGYPVLDTGSEDAEAICALRNAAPALLDELEAARGESAALQRKLTAVLANYNEEAGRLMTERDEHRDDAAKLQADLATARAVLDTAVVVINGPNDPVHVVIDRALWLAYQEAKR
jgi:hypothetical protein